MGAWGGYEQGWQEVGPRYVFGREDGRWKLLHRHADPLIQKTAPAAVLPATRS